MNGFVSLSPEFRGRPLQLGDLVELQILLDEASEDGSWRIDGEGWIPSGSLTLDSRSLRELPSEGNTTKLALDAMVHQPGPVVSGEFFLLHSPTGKKAKVVTGELRAETAQLAEAPPPPWTLPPVPFGGWNLFLLALLLLVIALALAAAVRKFLRRMPGRRQRDHRESALQALQGLQKFARAKRAMKQEEWKKFSFELAGILRKYSDENFQIDSSDMTDREFLSELRLRPGGGAMVDTIASILSTIDEVRYGKKDLDVTMVPGLLLESRKFVEQTFRPPEKEKAS
jgi:hypothetical protein